MTRQNHQRPGDTELEGTEVRVLIEELRYARHLIRSVGRSVRGLDPKLLEAWKAEVKAAKREIGYLDEPDVNDGQREELQHG